MLERIKSLCVHGTIHLLFYTIPRFLFAVLVRLPVTLFELITFKRPFTYSFKRERHIEVVTTSKDAVASARTRRLCGLDREMQYEGPMYSGHIHTVYSGVRQSRRVPYDRELVEAKDGNPICLDWLRVPAARAAEVKGLILIVPGLGNYSQTAYIQDLSRFAVRSDYHVCVLTPRGMGSAPLKVPRLTCATFTDDLRTTLQSRFTRERVESECGRPLPLCLLGFSAGGITILKGIAEELKDPDVAHRYPHGFPVSLCISVNAPYDFEVYAQQMARPLNLRLYQKALTVSLQKYAQKHWEVIRHGLPGLPPMSEAEMKRQIKHLRTVGDFEEFIVGPHNGYGNAMGYYKDGFAPQWVRQIGNEVTVVCVAARDDPIVGYGVTRKDWQAVADERPNFAYVETPVGGHLGYVTGPIDDYLGKPSFLSRFPIDVFDAYNRENAFLEKEKKYA